MYRHERYWSAEWHGHTIEVLHWWDILLRTYTALMVNGEFVEEHLGWSTIRDHMDSIVLDDGRTHAVEATIGALRSQLRLGCHILVDERIVGGDVDQPLLRFPSTSPSKT